MRIVHFLLVSPVLAHIQGVHVSLGPVSAENKTSVIVSWEESNVSPSGTGKIAYREVSASAWEAGAIFRRCSYVDGQEQVHALIGNLNPTVFYEYKIEASETMYTQKIKAPGIFEKKINAVLFADLGAGVESEFTFKMIGNLSQKFPDVLIHAGDIGYADDAFMHEGAKALIREKYEDTWKLYMQQISEAGASHVPYMVGVGNHESECHSPFCLTRRFSLAEKFRNFTAYNCRFTMGVIDPLLHDVAQPRTPASVADVVVNDVVVKNVVVNDVVVEGIVAPTKIARNHDGILTNTRRDEQVKQHHSMWHSFSLGPVGFISINTETDYPGAPEENHGDCSLCRLPAGHFAPEGEYLRWLQETLETYRAKFAWVVVFGHRPVISNPDGACENAALCKTHLDLLEKYADVYVSGHVHGYSRLQPINGGLVHLVNGGAGCDEWLQRSITGDVEAGTSDKFEYLRFGATQSMATLEANDTHLIIEALKSETGEIFDRVVLTRSFVGGDREVNLETE